MAGYTWSEIGSIFAMQGFSGLSLFCVFLLMALGLAIIFGQMGVINMAHGEFLTIGAYTTYLLSRWSELHAPALLDYAFFIAVILAFLIAFAVGYLVEMGLIRHLYKRPLDTLLTVYEKIGYPIIRLSAKNPSSLQQLETFVSNKIVAFVGQSGVGKSSLVNALIPDANAAVGEVSESGLGQHTTTSAQLFHFPHGGALIDSPGVREFGLWHIEADQLINGFIEFLPFIGLCKFRDCKHQKEPGCALKEALESKSIATSRFQSYFSILETLSTKASK